MDAQGLGSLQPPPLSWERSAPEEGRGGGAPQRQLGIDTPGVHCAGSKPWYLLSSAPTSRPWFAPISIQRVLAASQAQGPALNSPILSVGCSSPQRRGACFRPSRSGEVHSLKSGWMLKAAALSPRLQPLFSKSPTSSDAGCGRFFYLPAPGILLPLSACPPPPPHPHFSSLPSLCLQYFLLSQVLSAFQLLFPQPASLLTRPSRRSLPFHSLPPRPPPPRRRTLPLQLFPNLFLFSPASPHHEFPLSVPQIFQARLPAHCPAPSWA